MSDGVCQGQKLDGSWEIQNQCCPMLNQCVGAND